MDDVIRPIRIFGAILMAFAVFAAFFFLFLTTPAPFFDPTSPSGYERLAFYLAASVVVFYFLTGLGVLLLKKWGYYLFNVFLYLVFIAFPIGTVISYLTLFYMREHQINSYFGLASQRESPEPRPLAFSTKVILLMLVIGGIALYLWMMTAFF